MVNKQELLDKTGFIDENHLKELVKEPDYSGGAWTTLPCITAIGGAIGGTLGLDACPTSACTKSCNDNKK